MKRGNWKAERGVRANNSGLLAAALSMDLQWFAAEDEGRTHEPTEVTYRKAREEGRVAKSQELVAALGLLLPAITIILLAPGILRTCVEMLRFFYTRVNELDPFKDRLAAGLFFEYFRRLALPILIIAVISGLFSNLIQVGFLFTTKPLQPDFTKVAPKLSRLFSVEGAFNFFKSIVKMAIIGTVAFVIIRSKFKELVNLQSAGLWQGITLVSDLAAQLLVIAAVLLLALSVPDLLFQRWRFRESLKMTREMAKEEIKQDEGDQETRRRLRNRYREMLSQSMLSAVPNADVVITNPTHYSVALEFDTERMDAPTVIAKGEDDLALRIREVAKENGVPVVPHPALTRTLYRDTEVGDEIPIRYWRVVIAVVGEFFRLDQKQKEARRSANAQGGGTAGVGA